MPPALAARFLTTAPPGKSGIAFLKMTHKEKGPALGSVIRGALVLAVLLRGMGLCMSLYNEDVIFKLFLKGGKNPGNIVN